MENEQKKFSPADLLEPKIKIGENRTVPLFFATCQTAINNTSWKGSDLDNIKQVKQQLVDLLKFCQNSAQGEANDSKPNNESKESGVSIGDGIEPSTNEAISAPQVAEPAHSEPAPAAAAPATEEKKK